MAAEDYFDSFDGYWEDYEPEHLGGWRSPPQPPRCRSCNKRLGWRMTEGGKWRLWDNDLQAWHRCSPAHDFAPR